MSKLFTENKQTMVHIVSEVVVLVGLTFYFNQKNKKLRAHIEDLAQRLEEQEDLLQKHDQIIKQLVEHVSKQRVVMPQKMVNPTQAPSVIRPPVRKVRTKHRISSTPNANANANAKPKEQQVRVHFSQDPDPDPYSYSDSESETEVNFDDELQEELNDLIDQDDSLKKEQTLEKDA